MGPRVESMWVSVWGECGSLCWGLLVRGPPLLAFLHLTAEGQRDLHLLVSYSSVSVPLCHFSQHVPWASSTLKPSTHLLVPLRGPGSSQAQGLRSVPPSPELWRLFCALGSSPSLRPWLCPQCCVHPGGWSPEVRPGFREKPQHKQACACSPAAGPGPTCWDPDRRRAGPFKLSPGSGDPPGAGLSTTGVTVTQSPKLLCRIAPVSLVSCVDGPERKADGTLVLHRSLPTHWVTHPACWPLPSPDSGVSKADSR